MSKACQSHQPHNPDLQHAAVCGLFCPACDFFIGSHEDPARIARMAARFGWTLEQCHCDGCRSEKRTPYCQACAFVTCAADKGLDFCGECEQFPCEDLSKFQAARPHRLDLWRDQARIREVGYEQWDQEMIERYSCPECGTLNSAYDSVCRSCGTKPSCAYVAEHAAEIARMLSS